MTDYMPGGRRRLDRVLGPSNMDGDEPRNSTLEQKQREAEQEMSDLSELLELLQRRIAVIHAEQQRRTNEETVPVTSKFQQITPRAHTHRGPVKFLADSLGLSRLRPEEPMPHWERRRVERLIHDVELSDVESRTDDELARVLATFENEKTRIEELHSQVQEIAKQLTNASMDRPHR